MNLYWRLLMLRLRWLRPGRISIWDTARTPFRVVPTDLDLLLHMNNGKYLTLMDLGRMDLMVRSGTWAKLSAQGWFPVVAGQTITYRKSLKLGQRFDLYSRVAGLDDKWVYVEQTFCVGEVVYAHAVIRSRFLRKSGGSVTNGELEQVVGQRPEGREIPEWLTDWTVATRITEPIFDGAVAR